MSANIEASETKAQEIDVRECVRLEEFKQCVELQREVFGLPEVDITPLRHFVVTKRAGGFTLGAFAKESDKDGSEPHGNLVGFVHQLLARIDGRVCGYSHMTGVARAWQNRGVGAQLKWVQRARSLDEGIEQITWTFDPFQARNAHFNLNRLGVTVNEYAVNFYGTGYHAQPGIGIDLQAIDSDRLFAVWHLKHEPVNRLSISTDDSEPVKNVVEAAARVAIPADWNKLVSTDREHARREQLRVRAEFQRALQQGLTCAGFARVNNSESTTHASADPCYLFYPAS